MSRTLVDCPVRDDKPPLSACLDCPAFLGVAGTLGGDEVVVICVPRDRADKP